MAAIWRNTRRLVAEAVAKHAFREVVLGMGMLHSRLVDGSQILRTELLHGMIMRQTDIDSVFKVSVMNGDAASYEQAECGKQGVYDVGEIYHNVFIFKIIVLINIAQA